MWRATSAPHRRWPLGRMSTIPLGRKLPSPSTLRMAPARHLTLCEITGGYSVPDSKHHELRINGQDQIPGRQIIGNSPMPIGLSWGQKCDNEEQRGAVTANKHSNCMS